MLRKKPTQDRAEVTINTIYEASAHIIESDGIDKLTTNKLASKAGFSIGTLYQYFPNKQAIIQAIAEMGQSLLMRQMEDYFQKVEAQPDIKQQNIPDLIRLYIKQMLKLLSSESVLIRTAFRLCWTVEQPAITIAASKAVADRVFICLHRIDHPKISKPNSAQIFVMVRSMVGIIRYGVLERTTLWGTQQLENELVALIWAFMKKDDELEEIRNYTP
jgi:AcrR family transcriptional regulator